MIDSAVGLLLAVKSPFSSVSYDLCSLPKGDTQLHKMFALLVTIDETDGVQTLGFSETETGDGPYAILQKGANDSSVYFEVDDQINSAYDAIDGYAVDTSTLQLHLKRPVGKVTDSAVSIEFPESRVSAVKSAMSSLFDDSER